MTTDNIRHLEAALQAFPDNPAVFAVLLQAYRNRGLVDKAYRLVVDTDQSVFAETEVRVPAIRACLEADDPETALRLASTDDAEVLLLKAKALLSVDRHADGLEAYERAIARNAALEDPDLQKALKVKVTEIDRGDDRPRLRVIANDDTDEADATQVLQPQQEKIDFANVGGLDAVKKTITRKIILPFQKPNLFRKFRKKAGGGILLYGPPGCGKTMLARATAGEVNAVFYAVEVADVLDMYIGESERKLKALFNKARADAPAVLFFDEIEAIGGKRQFSRQSTTANVVSQFLSEMDGFAQNNHGVLILGATNVPWALDPAFRRPGRFDRLVFIPPPDQAARKAILKMELKDRPVGGSLDLDALAAKTSGYSGADLHELVETAADEAISESLESDQEMPITIKHLRDALSEVRSSTLEWFTTARNYARYANDSGQYDDVLRFLERHGK